ncbi:MAG: hypothetical protein AVDCRST_MAG89-4900, partial [uncultured Gemmatimonadetes bacterium]
GGWHPRSRGGARPRGGAARKSPGAAERVLVAHRPPHRHYPM